MNIGAFSYDLCYCYKIVNGFCNVKYEGVFCLGLRPTASAQSPPVSQKILPSRENAAFFASEVARIWNELPQQEIVEVRSPKSFKRRLSDFDPRRVDAI